MVPIRKKEATQVCLMVHIWLWKFFLPESLPSIANYLRDPYFFISSLTEPLWKTWIGHKMLAHKKILERVIDSCCNNNVVLRVECCEGGSCARDKATASVMRHSLRTDTQRAAMIINCCNQRTFPAFSPRMPHSTRFQSKVLIHLHNDSSIRLWGRGYCWSEDSHWEKQEHTQKEIQRSIAKQLC